VVGIQARYHGGYTGYGTMVGIPARVPWWVYTPGIYATLLHPGYTNHATQPATVHATRDRCDGLTALTRAVTERCVRHAAVTVSPVTVTRFTVGQCPDLHPISHIIR